MMLHCTVVENHYDEHKIAPSLSSQKCNELTDQGLRREREKETKSYILCYWFPSHGFVHRFNFI